MIIGLEGHAGATAETAGASFTLVGSAHTTSSQSLAAEYEIVGSTQSSVTVSFGTNQGAAWSMLVDAVQADPPGETPAQVQIAQNGPAVSVIRSTTIGAPSMSNFPNLANVPSALATQKFSSHASPVVSRTVVGWRIIFSQESMANIPTAVPLLFLLYYRERAG